MNTLFALMSGLSFYLLPAIIGTSFTLLLNRGRLSLYFIFESFALGGLVIFGWYVFKLPVDMLVIPTTLSLVASLVLIIKNDSIKQVTITKSRVLVVITIFILAVISYGIWRIDSPQTATLNWDLYHQQTLANLVKAGGFTVITTGLSDTFKFGGYTTLFHTLLATSQRFIQADILNYWWFLEFFHLFFTISASFLVAYAFTKSKTCGLVSSVLGAFVFEAHGAYTSLFLIPQNISATVGAVLLSRVFAEYQSSKRIVKPIYLPVLVFVFLNHFVIGSFVIGLYFILIAYLVLGNFGKTQSLQKWVLIFALLFLSALPFGTSKIDLNWLNRGEAQFFNFTLEQKDAYTKNFYGLSFYILVPLGALTLVLLRRDNHKALFLLCGIGLSLLLSPIPYSTKMYAVSRYFIHTLMALGFWLLIKRSLTPTKVFSLLTLSVTFAIIYIINILTYKQVPYYKDISTHVSTSELKAAQFLAANYQTKDALLLSDPATMHILEGLSGINTPGGAYTDVKTRQILTDIYYARDSKSMALNLMTIKDGLDPDKPNIYLLAVGGRFAVWQKASDKNRMGIQWNVWEPYDLKPSDWEAYDFIDFVTRYSKFKEVYKNSGIVIYEVQNNASLFI